MDRPPRAVEKLCRNPACSRKNNVVGNWCTAGKCKKVRAAVLAAEKASEQEEAAALAGGAPGAAPPTDGGLRIYKIISVHGTMQCGINCLGGPTAPPVDDKSISYVIFGTFAKTEQEYDDGRGKNELRILKLIELLESDVSDKDIKKLSAFDKHVPKANKAARKRLIDEIDEEDEIDDVDEDA